MSKLQHFRECLVVPNNVQYYQKLDHVPENLKECVENTRKRLRESADASAGSVLKAAVHLKESLSNQEDIDLLEQIISELRKNQTVKNDQSLWKFPVARINDIDHPNGNGRVYGLPLWKNVVENQRHIWQGGVGLADHPKDDDDPGEFKTSAIIWYDMMIDEANKLIWAIGSFVGTYGRLAQEIIEKGGKVGFSTSGFGELEFDKKTVNPDTFQIERVADIVTNPSQSVYGNYLESPHEKIDLNVEYSKQRKEPESETATEDQSLFEESAKSKSAIVDAVKLNESKKTNELLEKMAKLTESVIEQNKKLTESNSEKPMEENTNTEPMKEAKHALSAVEKAIISKYVENMTSEAEKIKKPADRLREVNKLLKMVEEQGDEDLKTKVQEALVAAKENLEKLAEQAADISEEFGDLSNLKENVKDIAKQGMLLNEQVSDYKLLAEGLTESNKALIKENEVLKLKLKLKEKAETRASNSEADAIVLNEKKFEQYKDKILKLAEDNEALSNECKALKEQVEDLGRSNRKLTDKIETSRSKLNEHFENSSAELETLNETIENLKKDNEALKESNAALEADNKALKESTAKATAEGESNMTEFKESLDVTLEELNKMRESLKIANEAKAAAEAKLQEAENRVKVLASSNNRLIKSNKLLREQTESMKNEFTAYKEDLKIENHLVKPFESQVSSQLNFRENRGIEVENYWQSLRETYGDAVLPYERQIRYAKTYREAFGNFLKYKESIDSSFGDYSIAKVNENVKGSARREALKESGMNLSTKMSVDEINAIEYERMKAKGFN